MSLAHGVVGDGTKRGSGRKRFATRHGRMRCWVLVPATVVRPRKNKGVDNVTRADDPLLTRAF